MDLMKYIWKIEDLSMLIFNKIYDFIYKHRSLFFWSSIVLIGTLIFFWSYFLPLTHVDDIPNLYLYLDTNNPRISSIQDIIDTQLNFYKTWSGRILFHGNFELMLMLGKHVVSLVNAISFILIGFMGAKLVSKTNKANKMIVLLILALYYYFSPTWEDVCLWATGFAIYGLPVPFVLTYLYCYLTPLKDATVERWLNNGFVLAIIGLIVGWSNENVSVALVFLVFLYLVYLKQINKLQIKYIIGYITLVIGCAILMLAPGNAVRAEVIKNIAQTSILYNLLVRVSTFAQVAAEIGFSSILFVIITYIFANKSKLHNTTSYILVILGALEMLAILGAPQGFPFRSFLPSMMVFICAGLINLSCIDYLHGKERQLYTIIAIIFVAFVITAGFYTTFTFINPVPLYS